MDDDEIEVIDLAPELGEEKQLRGPREPRGRRHPPRRLVTAELILGAVVLVGVLVLRPSSDHNAVPPLPPDSTIATPTTEWEPPAALVDLTTTRSLAVAYGYAAFMDQSRAPQQLLSDEPDPVSVGISQRGAALMLYRDGRRVIVGPRFEDGVRDAVPAAVTLLPDADGRWWSTLGEIEGGTELHAIKFPPGTIPIATGHDDYLLVDHARTALLRWHPGSPVALVANGRARILAISGDVVAWTNDASAADSGDGIVRLTDLRTGRVANVRDVFQPVTARFSPDGSRLAILAGELQQSMLLADTATGHLLAQVQTASGGNGLHVFTSVPPAFQPVPFSWAPNGGLTLIAQTTLGYVFRTIDPVDGTVIKSVAAPDGLEQLVALLP